LQSAEGINEEMAESRRSLMQSGGPAQKLAGGIQATMSRSSLCFSDGG